MPDKVKMQGDIMKGTESLIDMATEAELRVLGELVGLQLWKACFVRRAGDLGMSAQQRAGALFEIEEKTRQVMDLVRLLDECNANAIQAVTAPKH